MHKLYALLIGSLWVISQKQLCFSQTASNKIETLTGKVIPAPKVTQQVKQIMDSAHIPGLSLAIVNHSKTVYYHSFGIKDKANNNPVVATTLFEAASLTKPVFAFSILKLVEEGTLSLDKPLNDYLSKPYEGLTDERYKTITARMVLSHTTGFPNWRDSLLTIGHTPGEKFRYSGEGYVFLQKVAEEVTHMSLEKIIQNKVFKPLQMENSYLIWNTTVEQRVAKGHNESGEPIPGNRPKEANAAFSLYTTAEDYAKLLIAILKPGILQASTIAQMSTPQIKLSTDYPTLGWGLGLGLETTPQGKVAFHWGDNSGYKAYMVLVPEKEMALVYFTNSDNGLSILERLVDITLGGQYLLYKWLDYEQYNSPQSMLWQTARLKGVQAGLTQYQQFKKSASDKVDKNSLYKLGYKFYYQKKYKEAIQVFQLNAKEYPTYWKAYVALADAYGNTNQMDLCIQNLEKAIELNPDFEKGKQMLKQLKKE